MSLVQKNILANLGGGLWTALMSLAFVPLYIRFMGVEAYGLVGFYVTLQAVLGILDMGLKNTLNREFARLAVHPKTAQRMQDVLRTLEIPYWVVALLIGLGIVGSASWIASRWINAEGLPVETVQSAIAIMGVVIALRWPLSFYSGGLQGLQRQVLLNAIHSAAATARGVGAVLVLWLISPTVDAFFAWQAVVSTVHTGTVCLLTWRSLPAGDAPPTFRRSVILETWGFAAGISGTTLLATVLMQLDKIVLSRLLSLEMFGYYTLSSLVALSLYRLIHPIYAATYPRLTNLLSLGSTEDLVRLYHRSSQLVAACVLPVAAVIVFFPQEVLFVWTQDTEIARRAAVLVAVLSAGTAVAGFMNIPYALQLAAGWTRLMLYVNLVSVLLLVPCLLILTSWYGAVGAATTWVLLNSCYVLFAIPIMHRRLIPDEMWRWYGLSVGAPLVAAIGAAGVCRLLLSPPDGLVWLALFLLGVSVLTTLSTALSMPATRDLLGQRLAGWTLGTREARQRRA